MPDDQTEPASEPNSKPRRRGLFSALRALLRTRLMAGVLTIIPIWVTWIVIKFVFDTMKSATEPIAWTLARQLRDAPGMSTAKLDAEVERELIQDGVAWFLKRGETGVAVPAQQAEASERIAGKLTYLLEQVPESQVGLVSDEYLQWIVPIASVLLTLFLLYSLGLLTASVFGRKLIGMIERIFTRLPLVKTIYNSTKQVVVTLGGGQSMSFKRVVLVEFPRPGMKCIAFLTAVMKDADTGREMAIVFISTTPNPTTGYMQIVPLDEVSETGWSVEEAVRILISGGVLSPEKVAFDRIRKVAWEPSLEPEGLEGADAQTVKGPVP